jgi:hypothetical protein
MTPLKHRWAAAALDQSLAATNPASFDMPSLDLFLSTPLLCSTLHYITLPFSTLLHSMLLYSTQLNSTQLYKVSSTLLNSSSLYRYSTLVYSALAFATLLYSILNSPLLSSLLTPSHRHLLPILSLVTQLYSLVTQIYLLYSTRFFSTLLHSSLLNQPLVPNHPKLGVSLRNFLWLCLRSRYRIHAYTYTDTCVVRVNYVRVDVRAVPTWQTQKTLHSVLRFNFGKSDLHCVVEEKHTHMQVIVYLRFSLFLKSSKYLFNLQVKSHDGVRVQFFGSAAVKSGKCPTELRKDPEAAVGFGEASGPVAYNMGFLGPVSGQ